MISLDANRIHNILGPKGWVDVLASAGVPAEHLRNKHGPCPGCGGKDRFRFDNRTGRGDYYCHQCGAGDGFALIMIALGISFSEARKRVIEIANLEESAPVKIPVRIVPKAIPEKAKPTRRIITLLRESCAVEDCDPAAIYAMSRGLWPLPQGHGLRAHPSVEYWQDKQLVGRFPALIAPVRDAAGELVTVHVTYLDDQGEKLSGLESRKILSPMTGRESCAVRLMQIDGTKMGIAEGIETALSAYRIHSVPTWSALNTSLLQKFDPPAGIETLVVFADRDIAGLNAATILMQRLQHRCQLEIRTPQAKDWNDVLQGKHT